MKKAKKKTAVKKTARPRKASAPARRRKAPAAQVVRVGAGKGILVSQQLAVEEAKFSHPESYRVRNDFPQELPGEYGKDTLVLQVRDPWWLYSYWEVTPSTWERLKRQLGDDFYRAQRVLRTYDVTNIIFNGSNAHRFFDISISEGAASWYIDTGGPGRSWCVDLGLRLADGRFITILRSNVVQTPLDGPSWITDEEWMIPDELFGRLYGLGFGRSSPGGRAWQERLISSPGIASMASPVRKPLERKFWLEVGCELIVYGATDPGALVTVQGKPINLRRDGTFTLRFALPDGKQAIPVKAVSSDNLDERSITPTVTRQTQ